jgi:hypothetical protein
MRRNRKFSTIIRSYGSHLHETRYPLRILKVFDFCLILFTLRICLLSIQLLRFYRYCVSVRNLRFVTVHVDCRGVCHAFAWHTPRRSTAAGIRFDKVRFKQTTRHTAGLFSPFAMVLYLGLEIIQILQFIAPVCCSSG